MVSGAGAGSSKVVEVARTFSPAECFRGSRTRSPRFNSFAWPDAQKGDTLRLLAGAPALAGNAKTTAAQQNAATIAAASFELPLTCTSPVRETLQAQGRARTGDLIFTRDVLYQLSYLGTPTDAAIVRSRPMNEQPLLTERRDRVLLITLNRPDARNAVNLAMAEAMAAALDELDSTDELSVGVIAGEGKGFSSGMDLKAFATGERPWARTAASPGSSRSRPRSR